MNELTLFGHKESLKCAAAQDGSVEVFILPIFIFQRRNLRPPHACRPPRLPLGDT